MQKRRTQHVRHPRRRRQGEQIQLEPPVLPHALALASLAHGRDKVPTPPRSRRDAVVRRQEPRLLVPPVDLQEARRLKIVGRLRVVLPDRVERRHRGVERASEPSLRGHRPLDDALEPGGIVVPRPDERVVRHDRVRGVDGVFKKRRPAVRHVSHLPVVPIRPARGLAVLPDALDLRHEQRRRHPRLDLGLFPALAPRPDESLRLHRRARKRARPRVRLDPLLFLARARLRHVRALPVRVEPPRVVRAQKRAVVLDAAFGQRREAVRALVLERAPSPVAVSPHDEIDAEELRRVRLRRVDQVDHRDRVPLLRPVERPRGGRRPVRGGFDHRHAIGRDADERVPRGRVAVELFRGDRRPSGRAVARRRRRARARPGDDAAR
eukprot:29833-Pelagococcus_subviridis.AAC.1